MHMRNLGVVMFAALALTACEAPPVVEPAADNRALTPAPHSFGYTDADVEAMRQKIRTISYPAPQGETVRVLGLESPTSSSLKVLDYSPNNTNLATSRQQTYAINRRYELVVVENQYVDKGKSLSREESAEIRPVTR